MKRKQNRKSTGGDICGDTETSVNNFYLNNIENKEKKLVIIYSGGDDVFVAGAWVDVVVTYGEIGQLDIVEIALRCLLVFVALKVEVA